MTISRLVALQAVLLSGLGIVFLLPKFAGRQPTGVILSLPAQIGEWRGEDRPVSEKEKIVLGRDTEFARKSYTNGTDEQMFVSIVLAGQDVNTSLHQPERCLPAQGWTYVDKRVEAVPLNMKSLSSLKATRLYNLQSVTGANGERGDIFSLYYYWFVGYQDVIASPFERSLIDWRDRVWKGYNQRWAYVTVAALLKNNSSSAQAAEDAAIKRFIAELFPRIWKPGPNYSGSK